MNTNKLQRNKHPFTRLGKLKAFLPMIGLLHPLAACFGQGTYTFTFEAAPRGYAYPTDGYIEFGMVFWTPGPENLVLVGGGIATYPENGTGYLQASSGANLLFSFNTFPNTYFGLVSFDAAEYVVGDPPMTLAVVGYRPMASPVTNYFTLDGINDGTGPLQDFQTFQLDSRFETVYRVDILGYHFSLDNVLTSGIPEPSTPTLLLLAVATVTVRSWRRNRCGVHHDITEPTCSPYSIRTPRHTPKAASPWMHIVAQS